MPRPTVPGEFKVHQGKPVTIERVLELLETTLDGTTFVIADTGDALFATADITIPRAAEYMSSAYYASMGFAVPASLAVQLAFPDLRPIVIVGDGAFQITGIELDAIFIVQISSAQIAPVNMGWILSLKLGTHCLA